MFGPFVRNIDPIILSAFGVHVWWYGLSYSLGFFDAHLFLRRNREKRRHGAIFLPNTASGTRG
jgi:prolipoprotein diacylglyceryltransferase